MSLLRGLWIVFLHLFRRSDTVEYPKEMAYLPPPLWLAIKTFVFIAFFILLRATLPRLRYDQLMSYGWKTMLPLALLNLLITGAVRLGMG